MGPMLATAVFSLFLANPTVSANSTAEEGCTGTYANPFTFEKGGFMIRYKVYSRSTLA